MARAVRKVSRVRTKNQKKDVKFNKKWLIAIFVFAVLLGVGLGLGLGLYFGNKKTEYVSDKIYFTGDIKTSNPDVTVQFTKENYQTISRFIKDGAARDIFIFAYDGSAFHADEKDEKNYNETYEKLITRLADLQNKVNEANKKEENSVVLYIVDVRVDNAVNAGILSDSAFGALGDEDSVYFEPTFIYLHEDQFKDKIEIRDVSHKISISDLNEVYTSSIPYANQYIDSLFE